jgi:hypothetical protein
MSSTTTVSAGPANQRHGVVEAPAHHVGHGPVLALRDADNAVSYLQLAGEAGRPSRHQLPDRRVLIQLGERRADPDQRQPHRYVEIRRRTGSEVVGVRLDRRGVRVHECLEDIGALYPGHALQRILVTLVEHFDDALVVLAGKLEPQPVVLHPLAPQVAHFRLRLRPRFLFAQVLVALVLLKIESLLEQASGVRKRVRGATLVQIEIE